ncbi:MAG: DUF5667 domain-containing protein [Patescibacteria group bacterium]|nr:DUF5667 domain-containing protein [Patescibacteria group bacterium]
MNDKDLIAKLNILKDVKPESSWKQETRDLLLAQISNSVGQEVKVSLFEAMACDFKNFFSFLPSTAWAVICLMIILTGGSFGALAAKNSKPGDTLYIAKVWKEKIQLAMTFNQEDKAKLDMKLASIHAMEITEVLSDPNFNVAGNQKKAEQLAQNFKQEINTVKERYSEINQMRQENLALNSSGSAVNNTSSNLAAGDDNAKVGIGDIQKDASGKVYGVESGKDSKGLQFYDPNTGSKDNVGIGRATSALGAPQSLSSSSGPGSAVAHVASSTVSASENINTTLDKATQSFDIKDFSGAKDMLDQVGKIIANIDSGSVKGASESGTSTAGSGAAGTVGSSSGK